MTIPVATSADYLTLDLIQVGLAAALILVNGLISVALKLDLERRLALASVRTIVQLLLIGVVLQTIFRLDRWEWVVVLGVVMTTVAGLSAVQRTEHRYRGITTISMVSVWLSSWTITGLALALILRVDPWYRPQYAIPMLGMMLGNTLTGISLGLDRLGVQLFEGRDRIDAWLSLGATRWEAAREAVRTAVRTGLVPMTNAMMVVGLVSLPGLMTGQLLAGVDPLNAVKYQIVIMFLIASGTGLGTVGVVALSVFQLFNADHQFLHDQLRTIRKT